MDDARLGEQPRSRPSFQVKDLFALLVFSLAAFSNLRVQLTGAMIIDDVSLSVGRQSSKGRVDLVQFPPRDGLQNDLLVFTIL